MERDGETLQFFIENSLDDMSGIEKRILAIEAWELEDIDDKLVNEVLRVVHSIERGANSAGLKNIKELANWMGNILNLIHNKIMAPYTDVISVLLNSADVLSGLIKNADSSNEADISELLEELKSTAKIVKKPRVLIADDQNFFRTMIKKMLISMNCEVVGEATTGDETVELFLKEKPDLLLLDLHMPGKNGDKALEEIIGFSPNARVIILTSVGDSNVVIKCLKLGAVNYILKDTTMNKMKVIIEKSILEIME